MHPCAFAATILVYGSLLIAVDTDRPVIPDPYGMGYRLALIDFLHEKKISVPEGSSEENLIALYRRHLTVAQAAPSRDDQQDNQEKISQLRHKLRVDYHIDAPNDLQLPQLQEMAAQAESTARKRERERNSRILLADLLRRHPVLRDSRPEISDLMADPRPWPEEALAVIDQMNELDSKRDVRAKPESKVKTTAKTKRNEEPAKTTERHMVRQFMVKSLDGRPQQVTEHSDGMKTYDYYLSSGLAVLKVPPLDPKRLRSIGRTAFTDVLAERIESEYNSLAADRLVIINNSGLNAEVNLTVHTRPVTVIIPPFQTREWVVPANATAIDNRSFYERQKTIASFPKDQD